MEIKDYVTVTLSVLAFGLGLFNLWWGTFRRRIALFFVQGDSWSYALVNGGKTDVLVVRVKYWLSGTDPRLKTSPPQETSVEMPVLLKAGAALHHTVNFVNGEADFESLASQGRPVPGRVDWRAYTVLALIDWIDINGAKRRGEVEVAEVMFSKGAVRAWMPKTRRADLSQPGRFLGSPQAVITSKEGMSRTVVS